MKKFIVPVLALVAIVVLAGCGSSASVTKAEHSKDAQAGANFADHVFAKCVPNVLVLRNHDGRVKVKACVESSVPPAKRQAFSACATRALETSRSKASFKAKLDNCYTTVVRA